VLLLASMVKFERATRGGITVRRSKEWLSAGTEAGISFEFHSGKDGEEPN
jgi:hypothetical protein